MKLLIVAILVVTLWVQLAIAALVSMVFCWVFKLWRQDQIDRTKKDE